MQLFYAGCLCSLFLFWMGGEGLSQSPMDSSKNERTLVEVERSQQYWSLSSFDESDDDSRTRKRPPVRYETSSSSSPTSSASAGRGSKPESNDHDQGEWSETLRSESELSLQASDGRFLSVSPRTPSAQPWQDTSHDVVHCVNQQGPSERLLLSKGVKEGVFRISSRSTDEILMDDNIFGGRRTPMQVVFKQVASGYQIIRVCDNGTLCNTPLRCQGGESTIDLFKFVDLLVPERIRWVRIEREMISRKRVDRVTLMDQVLPNCGQARRAYRIPIQTWLNETFEWKLIDGDLTGLPIDVLVPPGWEALKDLPTTVQLDKNSMRSVTFASFLNGTETVHVDPHSLRYVRMGHLKVSQQFVWSGTLLFRNSTVVRRIWGHLSTVRLMDHELIEVQAPRLDSPAFLQYCQNTSAPPSRNAQARVNRRPTW